MTNHGIILGQRPEDWQAGAFTQIEYKEVNPSGDWKPFLVEREKQYGKEDSMSCVSFSAVSSLEMQYLQQTGKQANWSDRWIAKRSGTTINGNYLYKVGDTIRHDGMVLESDYPAPPNYTFAEYHADIDPAKEDLLLKIGQQWLSQWNVNTEFVPATRESILKHLKQAPLQIVIPGHAIVCVVEADANTVTYFDTYPHAGDFLYKADYSIIQAVYKYVLTPKTMSNVKLVKKSGEYGFYLPATTEESLQDKALNFGYALPLTPEGKIDWEKLTPDFELQ